MARTPQEIFKHHAEALIAGDVDEIVADYTDDAVVITPRGSYRGKDGVRESFVALLADLPDAKWDVPVRIFEGDVLFIEWTAETPTAPERTDRHLRLHRRRDPRADGPLHVGDDHLAFSTGRPATPGPTVSSAGRQPWTDRTGRDPWARRSPRRSSISRACPTGRSVRLPISPSCARRSAVRCPTGRTTRGTWSPHLAAAAGPGVVPTVAAAGSSGSSSAARPRRRSPPTG